MSYTKITNFAIKDTYLTGNPAKIVKGAEIDAEFDAIAAEDALNLKDADVQTSSVDTTAGRLLTVGAFGLGALGNATVISNIDDTASLPSGLARAQVATTGTKPTGAASNGQVFTERFSAVILKQTWTDVVGGSAIPPRTWVRTSSAVNTWGAWTEEFNAASTRLGYGVTPSAWTSTYNSFDMGWGGFAISNIQSVSQWATNHYFDGTNYKYKNTGFAYNLVAGAFGNPFVVQTAASGTAGNNVTFTNAMIVDANGLITTALPTGGVGYSAGAGGTVTQITSKATAVTLNKPCGVIATHNAALAAATSVSFDVNNSLVATTDAIILTMAGNVSYTATACITSGGVFQIRLTNITGGSLSQAVNINFAIIKGVSA